jgi:hypothetical protein
MSPTVPPARLASKVMCTTWVPFSGRWSQTYSKRPGSTSRPVSSIENLTAADRHARALMASGVLEPHERYHLVQVCDRIEAAVIRKRREEPVPLRPADEPA